MEERGRSWRGTGAPAPSAIPSFCVRFHQSGLQLRTANNQWSGGRVTSEPSADTPSRAPRRRTLERITKRSRKDSPSETFRSTGTVLVVFRIFPAISKLPTPIAGQTPPNKFPPSGKLSPHAFAATGIFLPLSLSLSFCLSFSSCFLAILRSCVYRGIFTSRELILSRSNAMVLRSQVVHARWQTVVNRDVNRSWNDQWRPMFDLVLRRVDFDRREISVTEEDFSKG